MHCYLFGIREVHCPNLTFSPFYLIPVCVNDLLAIAYFAQQLTHNKFRIHICLPKKAPRCRQPVCYSAEVRLEVP
jgi:hypothetical protein